MSIAYKATEDENTKVHATGGLYRSRDGILEIKLRLCPGYEWRIPMECPGLERSSGSPLVDWLARLQALFASALLTADGWPACPPSSCASGAHSPALGEEERNATERRGLTLILAIISLLPSKPLLSTGHHILLPSTIHRLLLDDFFLI
ncbi:hypothetical protein P7K49_021959 [Saguinus oedipus]|uniref:Uncharacterized protein n=1 Tax=Saguinus oedipus TaxID=9490 RepID=A0ABQ9UUW2_SAGOE|nr:hypothetical protein P7K49_021959 [Saguinus oedipus]